MGYQFEDQYGYTHVVSDEIARGGQGVVFKTQNPDIVLKIEFDESGLEFNKDVERNRKWEELCLLPIPDHTNLTLPQAALKEVAGYVMTLLDEMDSFENVFSFSFQKESTYTNQWLEGFFDRFPDFVNVIGQYILSGGRRRRLQAYLKAAGILASLHAKGLVYCDFSARNAFISVENSHCEVWLIDADNLDYQENTRYMRYYTPGYGAPEVMGGKGCTFYSDAYAFAVSLFWQLTGTHPFRGPLSEETADDEFEDDAEEKAYAGILPWIMDEDDSSNYTDTRIHQQYVVSSRLMRYFKRTFSELGKHKRQTRPTMFEWAYALAKDLDRSVKCRYCNMDYDASNKKCPWCDTVTKTVRFQSYGKAQIWDFVHEITQGEDIWIPYRLLRGFRVKEIDQCAFRFQYQGEHRIISGLNENYEWSVSVDGGKNYQDIFGRADIMGNCKIKCVQKGTKDPVLIEVAVK